MRRNLIKEELEKCRKVQKGGSSKKKYTMEAVITQDSLSQTSNQGPVFGEVFCHEGKANKMYVGQLEDGEINISDDSMLDVNEDITGGQQMMPCNRLMKEDVPYWCSVCNVRLPEDTPKAHRMHNIGKRHQAALQQTRAHEREIGGDASDVESLQFRISNDGETKLSALARLGDKRSVVFVPRDRRNVVARLGEKVPELTPQRKVELLEDHQQQE